MTKKLTPKQESFCVKYCETGDRTEAYIFAYDCKKAKQSTITNNAYKLLQNNDIVARIREIEKGIEQTVLWSKKQMILQLQRITLDELSSNSEKINAIKQAGSMLGYDKGEVVEQDRPSLNIYMECEKE